MANPSSWIYIPLLSSGEEDSVSPSSSSQPGPTARFSDRARGRDVDAPPHWHAVMLHSMQKLRSGSVADQAGSAPAGPAPEVLLCLHPVHPKPHSFGGTAHCMGSAFDGLEALEGGPYLDALSVAEARHLKSRLCVHQVMEGAGGHAFSPPLTALESRHTPSTPPIVRTRALPPFSQHGLKVRAQPVK